MIRKILAPNVWPMVTGITISSSPSLDSYQSLSLTFREEPFFIGTFWVRVVDSIGFHDYGSDNVEVPITDFIGTSR